MSDQVRKLIADYKNGDNEKLVDILNRYEGYLVNFARLLYHGNYDDKNKHISRFLELLHPVKNISNKKDKNKVNDIIRVINKKYQSYSYEDVLSELKYQFIKVLNNYDMSKLDFDYYLYMNFCYRVKKMVNKISNEPLFIDIPEDTNMTKEENTVEYTIFKQEIDNNWVKGSTCSKVFEFLNIEDRYILKLYYIEEYSMKEIGFKLGGLDESTISRRIERIKKDLKKAYSLLETNQAIIDGHLDEDTSIEEVAEETGLSVSTVYSRIDEFKRGDLFAEQMDTERGNADAEVS